MSLSCSLEKLNYRGKRRNNMGLTCKKIGKMKSITKKLENELLKEKKLKRDKKEGENDKKSQ